MTQFSETESGRGPTPRSENPERVVYVVGSDDAAGDSIDLVALGRVVWGSRALVAAVVGFCIVASVAYALVAKQWFGAQVLLAPAEASYSQSAVGALAGSVGGLASLAGVSVGAADSVEPLAFLTSRGFTRAFIEERALMPILFAEDWDAEAGAWKAVDPEEQPDIREAVKFFDEKVRTVDQNTRTGLVTLTVEWTDPEIAAAWANELVDRLNERMRQRALANVERNLEYLRMELSATSVVTLQQSISRLIESEMQKLMLARGNEEFSFKVIDRASPPKLRTRPKRTLIVAATAVVSLVLVVAFVVLRQSFRSAKPHDA